MNGTQVFGGSKSPATQQIIVIHCNHPRELAPPVVTALQQLRATGAVLLNQSVLLAGVNDNADTLCELSHALLAAGVMPYYLHALDPISGAAHFAVDQHSSDRPRSDRPSGDQRAIQLHRELLDRLPGYLVPRLVREEAGKASKTPLTAAFPPIS